MPIQLSPLPYDFDALEPYISSQTTKFHYKKHHKNYVDKVNKLVRGTPYAKLSLVEIILKTANMKNSDKEKKIFDNASQTWNHTFFWNCLSSDHNQKPSKRLTKVLSENFGSAKQFVDEFSLEASELFGSGWTWLVKNPDQSLEIFSSSNAENPLVYGKIPLLACDVWEHAYYLDYKNDRKTYIQNFWQVVDWSFVEKCLAKAVPTPPIHTSLEKDGSVHVGSIQ
ncbi:MAG: superoxide dismutase [Pseudomonadota bacterium]|nr:superoxide dismutase [Pseudomonadota bacterium]